MRPAVITTNRPRDDWYSSYNQCTEECGKPDPTGSYSDPTQPPCSDANRPWLQSYDTCMSSCINVCMKRKAGGGMSILQIIWRHLTREM